MNFDTSLFFYLNALAGRSVAEDAAIIFFANYLPYLLILVFLIFLVFSAHSRKEKIKIGAAAFLGTAVARFGVAEIIRAFYHRPRPFLAHSVHQLVMENSYSFPSGHAIFFFALSTVVYCHDRTWGIVFFIASVLIGIARVAAGVHYPSDIIGGAILGVIVGWLTSLLFNLRDKETTRDL